MLKELCSQSDGSYWLQQLTLTPTVWCLLVFPASNSQLSLMIIVNNRQSMYTVAALANSVSAASILVP